MKHIDQDYSSLSEVHHSVDPAHQKKGWRRVLAFFGPAYLVSVGYMDPGNWATDLAGGSQFGYKLIWVLLMSNLMALLLQSLSARLGIVRGRDLAQANRETYPKGVNFAFYILAEVAIAATDLAEILGMAIGIQLLTGLPLIWGVLLTVADTFLFLFLQRLGIRKMEAFIICLVGIIGFSFLAEMFLAKPDLGEVAKGFIPSIPNEQALYIAIGIIGATVMPHNLYLHSALVQTRKIKRDTEGIKKSIKLNFIDSAIALNLAFFVNAFILILAATVFYTTGRTDVAEIKQAHELLAPMLGTSLAPTLFAIALIASGQSSTITGTLAGQIVMEGHLNLRIQPWIRRLLTRSLAILPAFFTIFFFGEQALGGLLILSQVVLSLQLGFAVIPLIHFNSDREKMKEYTIKNWVKILAWLSALIIVSLNVQLVIEEIGNWLSSTTLSVLWIYLLVIPLAISIGILLLYVFLMPFFRKHELKISNVPHGEALEIGEPEHVEYKKIGITVDFSKNDRNTFRHALIQGGINADYYLIHIVETAAARFHGEKVLDHETQRDTDNLEKYQHNLKEMGYRSHIEIGYGLAAKSISELVKARNMDLLVMGAHGHKGISDLIFGTTVDAVRHKVNIPIMIVK